LSYDAVLTAQSPDNKMLLFLESTYEVAAILSKEDHASLELAGEEKSRGHLER